LPRAQGVRRRGYVLIVLGFLLVAIMGTITFVTAPTMLSRRASSGVGFTGTPEQALLILGLFGIVIVFGITCIGSGLWQIVTGRRSIWIVVIVLGLTFLLIVAGSAVRRALDGGSDRTKVDSVGVNLLVRGDKRIKKENKNETISTLRIRRGHYLFIDRGSLRARRS
jgi:hypothetical protein